MTKPAITTRAGKGSALTWVEGDANFTNLQDATISIKAGSAGTSVTSDLNGEVTLVAGTNISLAGDNTAKTITITNTASPGASTLNELSDVTLGTPATDEVLQYNGTAWVDVAPSTLTVGTATNANNINVADNSTLAGIVYPLFVTSSGAGYKVPSYDAQLQYNPNTNTLAVSVLSVSSSISGTGFSNYLASPPAIGSTTAGTGRFTTLTVTSGYSQTVGTFSISTIGNISISTTAQTTISSTTTGTINNMSIGAGTASTGAFTTLSATSTVSGAGFSSYLASPPAIGSTTASTGAFTTLSASSTVSGTGFSSYLASPPAIGSTTPGTGRFTTLEFDSILEPLGTASTATGAYTYAPNAANGSTQTLAMSTATALTFNGFTSPVAGQSITILVTNNATVTSITSTMKWAGGIKTLTGTSGALDMISVYYDGTNYWASISKGFA